MKSLERPSRPVIFLDRDGVINKDTRYVARIEDLVLFEETLPTLRRLCEAGYWLVVVTNQSGIARGYYEEEAVHEIHAHLEQVFAAESIDIKAWYYCPHHAQGTVESFRQDCNCRKPKPGMIQQALEDYPEIQLSGSWMVGDKASDVECGLAMELSTIQVVSELYPVTDRADFHVGGIAEAADVILSAS